MAGKIKEQIHKMEEHHEAKKAVEHKEKEQRLFEQAILERGSEQNSAA